MSQSGYGKSPISSRKFTYSPRSQRRVSMLGIQHYERRHGQVNNGGIDMKTFVFALTLASASALVAQQSPSQATPPSGQPKQVTPNQSQTTSPKQMPPEQDPQTLPKQSPQ